MTNWLPAIEGRPGPKYLAIADSISEAIASGVLEQGSKLPPQRNLAYDLRVTLGTVTRAYREIERRGLTGGEVGRGTFVLGGQDARRESFIVQQPESPNVIELIHATPIVPFGDPALRETLTAMASDPTITRLLGYQMGTGTERHRDAGVSWLKLCGLNASLDTVTITSGGQQGVLASLMAIAKPGDTIMVEELTYPGIIHLAHTLGYRLEPLPTDDQGILPDALAQTIKQIGSRLLYYMPTLQNPTVVTMPEKRRREIAGIVRSHGITVIEDDIWGVLGDVGIPPLAAIVPEQVIYLSSLSKCLAGGLRMGYVNAPNNITRKLHAAMKLICWMAPPLMAEITCRWINDGTADRLTREQRRLTAERINLLRAHLKPFGLVSHSTAYHTWLPVDGPWTGESLRVEAEARGVRVLSDQVFRAGRRSRKSGIRICVGRPSDIGLIERAGETIADILNGRARRDEMFI